MATYTITATIHVDITNTTALDAIAGTGGDERSQVQSAIDAGLAELPGIGRRYGFDVTSATATVE